MQPFHNTRLQHPHNQLVKNQFEPEGIKPTQMGLDYSFVDKNKSVKKNIAASMENVAEAVDKDLDNEKREDFHELLPAYTGVLSKN